VVDLTLVYYRLLTYLFEFWISEIYVFRYNLLFDSNDRKDVFPFNFTDSTERQGIYPV